MTEAHATRRRLVTAVVVALLVSVVAPAAMAAPAAATAPGSGTIVYVTDDGLEVRDASDGPLVNGTPFTASDTLALPNLTLTAVGAGNITVDVRNGTTTNVSAVVATTPIRVDADDKQPVTIHTNVSALAFRNATYAAGDTAVDFDYTAGQALNVSFNDTGLADGVTVRALDADTGTELQNTTVSAGNLSFANLPAGTHTVNLAKPSSTGGGTSGGGTSGGGTSGGGTSGGGTSGGGTSGGGTSGGGTSGGGDSGSAGSSGSSGDSEWSPDKRPREVAGGEGDGGESEATEQLHSVTVRTESAGQGTSTDTAYERSGSRKRVDITGAAEDSEIDIDLLGTETDADAVPDADDERPTADQSSGNIVPERMTLAVRRGGDYNLSVESRELDVESIAAAGATPDDGVESPSELVVTRSQLSTDGQRFVDATTQRPVGYLIVDHTFEDANLSSVTHRFKVRKSYLDATGSDVDTVRLYRDEGDRFRPLDTRLVGESDAFYRFEAESPGLSVFVIGSEAPAFSVDEPTLLQADALSGEVEAALTVENVGSANGTYTAQLAAGTVVVDTVTVAVEPGETATLAFEATVETADQLTLSVSDTAIGTLEGQPAATTAAAAEPSGGSNSFVVGVLIVGLMSVALFAVWWRRRTGDEEEDT
ncbi:PGF-pre-PGF domain-containing protein [Halobellus sp. Atlit-31R]|nr:PGF-pre-PGF domain-containing protein [Halobellus sp. Atlit-31R]